MVTFDVRQFLDYIIKYIYIYILYLNYKYHNFTTPPKREKSNGTMQPVTQAGLSIPKTTGLRPQKVKNK